LNFGGRENDVSPAEPNTETTFSAAKSANIFLLRVFSKQQAWFFGI